MAVVVVVFEVFDDYTGLVIAEHRGPLDPLRVPDRGVGENIRDLGWPPMVLRMDNGPEFISEALQAFCAGAVGISYIPPGTPWNRPAHRGTTGSSSRSTTAS